jgi:hypothetical protein
MASNIFPVAVTSGASPSQKFVTAVSPVTGYKALNSFDPGVYTITTSPVTSQAYITFWNANNLIVQATTISGSVTVNLASAATHVTLYTDTGSNIVVGFNQTGTNLSPTTPSGTVDTISATGTYATTGTVYVVAIGGGASGGAGATYNGSYCSTTSGGSTGGMVEGWVTLTTSTSVTIGSGGIGVGPATYSQNGNPGGTTSFGAHFIAGGGRGGSNSCCSNGFSNPASNSLGASTFATISQGYNYGVQKPYFTSLGSTSAGENASGSGIGLGGQSKGANGTGYGSGGAGGSCGVNSGNGAPGVVYVIRNFT